MNCLRAFFISVPLISAGQSWIRLTDFPSLKRDDGVAVVCGNNAYFGTGMGEGWVLGGDFYALSLPGLTWSQIPSLPPGEERQYACAFAGGDGFFVFGGYDGNALNDLWKFDPSANAWTKRTDKPGAGLIGASCMTFGDHAVIVGGKVAESGGVSNEVWDYHISTDTWTKKQDIPFGGRWRGCAAQSGATGYYMFGFSNTGSYRKEMFGYSFATDAWTKLVDFPDGKGRAYSTLRNIGDYKLVLFGGQDTTGLYHKSVWYFDLAQQTWYAGPDLPAMARRGDMSCVWRDWFLYSCGLGEGDTRLNETWMMDVPAGVNELRETLIRIYPNPTKDKISINCDDGGELQYTLCAIDGSLADNGVVSERTIDLGKLAPGIYVLNITNGLRSFNAKVIRN